MTAKIDDAQLRDQIAELVRNITAWDEHEAQDREYVLDWIATGAPLCRVRKPDVPPQHLVSYVVVVDDATGSLLLVDHRAAALRLPTGGHVESGELPWTTVLREGEEELQVALAATPVFGAQPLFVTVTTTRDPHELGGQHTDISLWHIASADRRAITEFDASEFTGIHWMSTAEIFATPIEDLDPHMHRFLAKYEQQHGVGAA